MSETFLIGFSWIGGYLLGAIPTAVIVAKTLQLPDPRSYGSGNPGATNMLRGGGQKSKKAAIITLIGDAAKGAIAVLLAGYWAGEGSSLASFAMMGAVVGHCFSIWLKFRGGKGVATAMGALLVFQPVFALAVLAVFAGVFGVSRMVSLASTLAALAAPFLLAFAPILRIGGQAPLIDIICLSALSMVVIYRHRENLKRIWAGTESPIGRKRPDSTY